MLEPLFRAIDAGRIEAVTSALTLLEVLAVPLRAGNEPLALRYESLLTRGRGLHLLELTRPLLRAAAQLRAVTSMRTPDALQVAAALAAGATRLLTSGRRIPEVPGLAIVQLEDHLTRTSAARAPSRPR